MPSTELTIENTTWAGADVFAWADGQGEMVARLGIVSNIEDEDTRCAVRMENGRTIARTFRTPDAALAAIAEALR